MNTVCSNYDCSYCFKTSTREFIILDNTVHLTRLVVKYDGRVYANTWGSWRAVSSDMKTVLQGYVDGKVLDTQYNTYCAMDSIKSKLLKIPQTHKKVNIDMSNNSPSDFVIIPRIDIGFSSVKILGCYQYGKKKLILCGIRNSNHMWYKHDGRKWGYYKSYSNKINEHYRITGKCEDMFTNIFAGTNVLRQYLCNDIIEIIKKLRIMLV